MSWMVSILVLVDLAHESLWKSPTHISRSSFNPCFSGSCSRIYCAGSSQLRHRTFQSLFQWILLTNELNNSKLKLFLIVSILVLVDLAHEFWRRKESEGRACFNPCFSGSCSRILPTDFSGYNLFKFQSLFQWILLTNYDLFETYKTKYSSFNPCFSGSCSRIQLMNAEMEDIVCFNPCFSGSCSRITAPEPEESHYVSFNPCFSGSCSRIYFVCSRHLTTSQVSILVLVDLAHEYVIVWLFIELQKRFQSLFQWILLTNRGNFSVIWLEKA